jgi:hypothetical protein
VPLFGNMLERLLEHIKAHEINVDAGIVTMGPWLQIDRQNERFKDSEPANRLVRGFYREPYIVPPLGTP